MTTLKGKHRDLRHLTGTRSSPVLSRFPCPPHLSTYFKAMVGIPSGQLQLAQVQRYCFGWLNSGMQYNDKEKYQVPNDSKILFVMASNITRSLLVQVTWRVYLLPSLQLAPSSPDWHAHRRQERSHRQVRGGIMPSMIPKCCKFFTDLVSIIKVRTVTEMAPLTESEDAVSSRAARADAMELLTRYQTASKSLHCCRLR